MDIAMRLLFSLFTLSALTVISASSSAQAASDPLTGFWRKGDATNWSSNVKENSSSAIKYRDYPIGVDKAKQDLKSATQQAAEPQNPQNSAAKQDFVQAAAAAQAQPETPLTREQIVAKYGSPDQSTPIRAQKDSPTEMQGLFAALNSGDKELAWQYSLALARRNTEMQSLVSKATDYQMLAFESLGMREQQDIDAERDQINPNRLELQQLMAKTREAELKKKIDIEQTLKGQEGAQVEAGLAKLQAEAALAAEVPVDPEGKVKVLVFFNEQDASLKEVVKSLEPLKETLKANPKVSVIGLTRGSYALPGLKKIGATSSFPFPLLNGEALAQELRIQSYPTVVFLAVTSKQTYRLEGLQKAEEIERVVKLMQGQR